LATSRTVLGLRAEREYPVPAAAAAGRPASRPAGMPLQELMASPAVALFVDRARAVRPTSPSPTATRPRWWRSAAAWKACRWPSSWRPRAPGCWTPGALFGRLCQSLDALGTGAVDLPERQRTLRATVEWSVGLLGRRRAVSAGDRGRLHRRLDRRGRREVAGLEEDRALELTEALARHSLVQLDRTDAQPAAADAGDHPRVRRRAAGGPARRRRGRAPARWLLPGTGHAGDRPLRGAGRRVAGALQAEAGNLAAAVRWYLAHDP
jgi:hypothetical protein